MKPNLELASYSFDDLCQRTQNVYKSVRMIGERANQEKVRMSVAFRAELADLSIVEGGDRNNPVDSDIQEIVSKRYEMARKPLLVAVDEMLGGKLEDHQETNDFHFPS